MLARTRTFTIEGLQTRPVTVEVDIRPGLPAFAIVGLADASVREARERVQAAILNSGYEFPGAADHREPRARGRAEGRPGLGPGAGLRACWPRASSCRGSGWDARAVRRAGARRRACEPVRERSRSRRRRAEEGRGDAACSPRASARGDAGRRARRSRRRGACSSAVRVLERRPAAIRCPRPEDPEPGGGAAGARGTGPERRARPASRGAGAGRSRRQAGTTAC